MKNNWKCIYTNTVPYQVEIAKAVLKDHGIDSVIMNKQDSAYISIGQVELYVSEVDAEKAHYVIKASDL